MMVSKRLLRGALFACSLLGAAAAHAQPSPAQKETARGLMTEGRELRDKGDLSGALSRFSAADSIMGVPTTGFEVAATQAELGRLVEARDTLHRLLAIAPSADDPEPFNEARSKARTLDQQLAARIASLRFEVSGLAAGEVVDVSVDNEAVPRAVLHQPFRVNPGHHVIVAHSHGREVKREVDAADARAVDVQLAFVGDAVPAPAPPVASNEEPAPPRAAPAHPAAAGNGLPTLTYVGGGVGVAGILIGSITGISAISHKNTAKKGCVSGGCPPSTWSDLDSARSLATTSTVAFVVGALGLGVGVGAILLGDDRPRHGEQAFVVSPDVGPQGARLSVAGRF
jgi:hypothetical protein